MHKSLYENYYRNYLGLSSIENLNSYMVIQSVYRDFPINQRCYYPIIITQMNASTICSCSKEYYKLCKNIFDGTIESMPSIRFQKQRIRRYSMDATSIFLQNKAISLNDSLLRTLDFNIKNNIEMYIESKKEILRNGRQFAYIEKNRILATAFISDIHCFGGNIVVYTDPDYRSKGYGKEVVKACVNWCISHRLLPIYLVEESNINSIHLAESLGFELMNTEWVLTDMERNQI